MKNQQLEGRERERKRLEAELEGARTEVRELKQRTQVNGLKLNETFQECGLREERKKGKAF